VKISLPATGFPGGYRASWKRNKKYFLVLRRPYVSDRQHYGPGFGETDGMDEVVRVFGHIDPAGQLAELCLAAYTS
jgi:hypothetical protein